MNRHFIINGQGGSGKDAFINLIGQYYNDRIILNVSSIDPIKKIAAHGGWRGEKTDKARKMLSDLKKLFIEYNDLPTNYLKDQMSRIARSVVIFMHVREATEIDKLKKTDPSIKTILIYRETDLKGNDSDDMVYDYKYDYIIDNNGSLEDLEESVATFINEVILETSLADDVKQLNEKL
jgi:hypothetical protein